jgi:hypothetical protein
VLLIVRVPVRVYYPVVTLAEIRLYGPRYDTQVPASELTVLMSSNDDAYPASNCFDGNTDNACQSATTDPGITKMFVVYPCNRAIKKVVVHNRPASSGDEPARINAYTMDVVAANGTVTFSYKFAGGQPMYDIPLVPVTGNPSW